MANVFPVGWSLRRRTRVGTMSVRSMRGGLGEGYVQNRCCSASWKVWGMSCASEASVYGPVDGRRMQVRFPSPTEFSMWMASEGGGESVGVGC